MSRSCFCFVITSINTLALECRILNVGKSENIGFLSDVVKFFRNYCNFLELILQLIIDLPVPSFLLNYFKNKSLCKNYQKNRKNFIFKFTTENERRVSQAGLALVTDKL